MVDQIQQEDTQQSPPIVHNFVSATNKNSSKMFAIFIVVAVAGIGAGFFLSHAKQDISQISSSGSVVSATKGTILGSNDTSTFKDTATGVVQKGGIDGEGQFHLVRPGGDSQNVYLTSSIVDLSQFVGKKVTVNGQTQAAKKAGWLMDVGRVEVVE